MIIKNAKYNDNFDDTHLSINATIDGTEMSVPLDTAKRHYEEIMRQVDAGTLTLEDAD